MLGNANLLIGGLQDASQETGVPRESWRDQADCAAAGTHRCTLIAFADGRQVGLGAVYRDGAEADEGEDLQFWCAPAGAAAASGGSCWRRSSAGARLTRGPLGALRWAAG